MNEHAPPAQFNHCVTVYNKMLEEAKVERADGDSDIVMTVWTGYTTKLFDSLGMSTPYYTTVTRNLMRMGCIKQLRRGGGTATSQWELLKEPTYEAYTQAVEPISQRSNSRTARLETEVNHLKAVLARLTQEKAG